jgi:hypothetical protein
MWKTGENHEQFLMCLLNFSLLTLFSRIITKQVSDSHPGAPLMTPDRYKSKAFENEERFLSKEVEARDVYQFLSGERQSWERKCGFVFGALYRNFLGNYQTINACGSQGISIEVTTACRKQSIIRILDATSTTKLVSSVTGLGASLEGVPGNCQKHVGDIGYIMQLCSYFWFYISNNMCDYV